MIIFLHLVMNTSSDMKITTFASQILTTILVSATIPFTSLTAVNSYAFNLDSEINTDLPSILRNRNSTSKPVESNHSKNNSYLYQIAETEHPFHPPATHSTDNPRIISAADEIAALPDSESDQQKTVLINFNNVSMVEYIRFVSRISNRNFIFDENDLQFNVTIISGRLRSEARS